MTAKKRAVLVTTERRGVFFGYLTGTPKKASINLTDARNCVYWDTGIRGFMGLASHGPGAKCKVGSKVPSVVLYDITSVCACSPDAVERWEQGPWAR